MKKLLIIMAAFGAVLIGSNVATAGSFGSYNASAFQAVGFDQNAAASNGVLVFGQTDYGSFHTEFGSGTHVESTSGDNSFFDLGNLKYGQSNSNSSGYAVAGDGNPAESYSLAYKYTRSYITFYNSTNSNYLLNVISSHYLYAGAYSNANPTGYSEAIAQTSVGVFYNQGNSFFQTESWGASAVAQNTLGIAGPFQFFGTIEYGVYLTPGYNYLVVQSYAYGYTDVTAPEPASMSLLAAGALGMLGYRMRKRKMEVAAAA